MNRFVVADSHEWSDVDGSAYADADDGWSVGMLFDAPAPETTSACSDATSLLLALPLATTDPRQRTALSKGDVGRDRTSTQSRELSCC